MKFPWKGAFDVAKNRPWLAGTGFVSLAGITFWAIQNNYKFSFKGAEPTHDAVNKVKKIEAGRYAVVTARGDRPLNEGEEYKAGQDVKVNATKGRTP